MNPYVIYLKLINIVHQLKKKGKYHWQNKKIKLQTNTWSMILCICPHMSVNAFLHIREMGTDPHLLGMVTSGEGRRWGRKGLVEG